MTHTPAVPTVPVGLEPLADGRQSAPAAQRNQAPLLQQLTPWLRPGSRVLELASGTGEHAVAFNQACPGLHWQPTDIAPERLQSIAAWTAAAQLGHAIAPPLYLDVGQQPWPVPAAQWDGVLAINLLHVMPAEHLPALFAGVRAALQPAGWWRVYGPFHQGAEWFSEGNRAFHAQLQALHPSLGLRDLAELAALARAAGFGAMQVQPMPANNQLLCWRVAEHG